eukprot:3070969-Alexandrium_andersonii.AAC.1
MRHPLRAVSFLPRSGAFRDLLRPCLESYLQSHSGFEDYLQGLLSGARALHKGECPPGLAKADLDELRVKALAALEHPPPS